MWKVLIADDEPKIRKGLKKMLQSFDLSLRVVGEAEEGEQALEMAKTHQPHILLVDINMPFLDGLGLIERVRQFSPDMIIIIITGYDEFKYAKRAIQLQVSDYLLKPINGQELKEILLKAIDRLQHHHAQPQEEQGERNPDSTQREAQGLVSPIVALCKKYVAEHYMEEELSLQAVADHFDISPSYLCRLMKQELGHTFVEYLTEVRMTQAKRMLEEESIGVKIHEVAQLVGYNSQHYFSRVFKKTVGVTPLEYRQGMRA